MPVIELLGDGQPEHRVAEELQPLVGGQPAVLVGVAAVRQRDGEQFIGQVHAQRLEQRRAVRRHDGPPGSSVADCSGSMAASFAQRGSICSWWCPGSAVASGIPHCGHSPGQSGPHVGANGSASPTASMMGCSRSTVSIDDASDLVGFGGRVGGAVGIGEQLGEVDLDMSGDRRQAARALPRRRGRHRAGDQHALRYRLDPQVQFERRALVDRDQIEPDARRAGHRLVDGQHGTRSAAEPGNVDHERRSWIAMRCRVRMRRHDSNPTATPAANYAACGCAPAAPTVSAARSRECRRRCVAGGDRGRRNAAFR